jgi:CCR4-NOT complex subunit CAF16
MVEQQQPLQEQDAPAVRLDGLTYAYPGCEASVKGVSLDLPRGARCLLIGANGAGMEA